MIARTGEEHDYYAVLEVAPDAPQDEITRAYQRARETYSPESPAIYTMFTEAEARELVRLVEEAFSVLGNRTRRFEYDALRKHGPSANLKSSHEVPKRLSVVESSIATPSKVNSNSSLGSEESKARGANSPLNLPQGYGKTPLSVYEIKEKMEEEFNSQVLFDGPALQKIRLYKNLNLEQISEYLRVSKSYLVCIENNDFTGLPAPVFTRGFVVQLAKLYGLDEKKVAQSYMDLFKKSQK